MTSTDPLLRPTLQQQPRSSGRPWRLISQGYVAFFGGTLAGTAVAVVNATRLGLPRRRVLAVASVGAAALAATLALLTVGSGILAGALTVERILAMAAYLWQVRLQREPDRVFVLRGGEYAPLLGVGVAAVAGLGLLEGVLVHGALAAVSR
ncbi:hypothetical protein [Peterkaempfera bronchialis]|uniref:Uncharacterized protein n=1 Tax=Peterkaempfera bronchialis TaxID=2126346 RepID=A0A345SUB8_9ACTN|nr:hypothetical protein [Peterkaempfera bronchialis]AXI77323.1 hypothetical protein C7M71_007595 [Peterkaempfera bronchialis]